MRTNAASSVKDGRYYLQLAGAEARERLLLAAADLWNAPVAELTAKNSIITHARSGRTVTYGHVAQRAAQTPHPHPETITIKPPDQWTLMGTEQRTHVPLRCGRPCRDRRAPAGMKWAAVKGVRLRRRGQAVRFRAVRNIRACDPPVPFPDSDPRYPRRASVAASPSSPKRYRPRPPSIGSDRRTIPRDAAVNTAMMRGAADCHRSAGKVA